VTKILIEGVHLTNSEVKNGWIES